MNKLLPFLAFSILLLAPVGAQNAFAVPVPVVNGDFEDPVLAENTVTDTVTGWTESETDPTIFGILHPTLIQSNLDPSEVENVLFIDSELGDDGNFVSQIVGTYQPFTEYTLTASAGAPSILGNFNIPTVLMGFSIGGIQHEGTNLITGAFGGPLIPGQTVILDPLLPGDPLIGQPLEIQFFIDGGQGVMVIDNVQLDAVDVSTEDDDGDGVQNSLDMCPGEDDLLDTDGDGIPDCLDENPTLFCGENAILVGFECQGTSGGMSCGIGTFDNGNGECESFITECGSGTSLENGVCTLLEQCAALGSMIGGTLLEINTVSLLVGAIGVNPIITGLVGITIAGAVGQAVWFVHKRRK